MKIQDINKALRDEAISHGLCDRWQRMWGKDWDIPTLIERYKEGIDFCILQNYPSNDFIKSSFPQDTLREHGILVDDTFSLLNPECCVLLGNSHSTIRLNGDCIGNVYIRHASTARVETKNRAFAVIHLLDHASVECESSDMSSSLIVRHGDDTVITSTKGNVKIKDSADYSENNS